MSCHPFQVDEVFRCIVEQLVPRSPRSALSLALCCKSFADISLGVLWEQQKRLSTLIKVLPPDAWAYQETDSYAGELVGHPRPLSHGQFRVQHSLLRSVDNLAGSHIAGVGKVEEVRVVDARTRIPRGRRRDLSRRFRHLAPESALETSLPETPQAILDRRSGIWG